MRRIKVNHGDVYNDLEVIREVESSSSKRRFLCECSCGDEVSVRLDHLRSGHTTSCGSCGVEHNGQRKTIAEWARSHKINESTLRARLKIMSIQEALERGRVQQ